MKNKLPTLTALTLTASASLLFGQAAQQTKQAQLGYFGAEIGNQVATTATSCYIGTAGTLVTDGANDYILSNSHVLAREGAGIIGEDIMHTVSTFCDPSALHVGELAADVTLQYGRKKLNRVDAALARITPNVQPATDASGRILHIGNSFSDAYGVTNSPVSAYVGLGVKKSGRTTGLTASSVSHVNANVVIRYDGGRAYFDSQIVVSGSGFSAGGDSGSLIVTNDASANPVGLLFAGSSSSTIANPIGDVMSLLGAEIEGTLSFGTSNDAGTFELTPPPDGGGGGGGGKGNNGGGGGRPFAAGIDHATAMRDKHEARLSGIPGVVGTGIGVSGSEAVITLFLDKPNPGLQQSLPARLEGVKLDAIVTGEFEAY